MLFQKKIYTFGLILLITIVVRLEAITVNPLCPTNKIAPRRKYSNPDESTGRTFGVFYDLLAPSNLQNDAPSDLQEKPQEDDPDDCGEIEDYDENDLSSITPKSQRRKGARHNGALFSNFFNVLNTGTIQKPPVTLQPQRPSYHASRPPFWSGGYFGGNFYRPPAQQNPSDYIKPVNENIQPAQAIYRPHIVGGPLGHIVGFSTSTPTTNRNEEMKLVRTPRYYSHVTATKPSSLHRTRQPAPRKNENTIFGSFVDLFFK